MILDRFAISSKEHLPMAANLDRFQLFLESFLWGIVDFLLFLIMNGSRTYHRDS
jgi:hypothetical protein